MASGGNTGSQAATLVTRAMALGEIRLRDVFKVFKRELIVSSSLGATLALIGFVITNICNFAGMFSDVQERFLYFAGTIATSVGVLVIYGSLVGSMLPFLLKFCHIDPASASAPFVTTIVDVSGIIIYFTIARLILGI